MMDIVWPKYTLIPVDQIVVDKDYQRELSEKRVEKIVNDFDPELFGVVKVAHRHDGTYAVIDGQHRVASAAFLGAKVIPATISTIETTAHEADTFVKVNTLRKSTTPFQNWKAAAFADPTSLEAQTNAVLASLGLELVDKTKGKITDSVRAVGAVREVLEKGGLPLIKDVFYLLKTHFHGMDAVYSKGMISGLAHFLYLYEDKITWDKLNLAVERELKNIGTTLTPVRILQQAMTTSNVRSKTISDRFLKAYNSQNKTKIQYRDARIQPNSYVGFH